MSGVWDQFTMDPRSETNAGMRAGDADREVVRGVLTSAYAEGRLDPAELDERSDHALAARTLGELPALISDLVSPTDSRPIDSWPTAPAGAIRVPDPGMETRAVERWQRERKEAAWLFLSASVICWVIWLLTSGGDLTSFPWPVFPMLGTGINVGRIQFMRTEMIGQEEERLRRKEAKALRRREEP